MKVIESIGKDIESALKSGLAELGCKIDDVDVKVLEHPGIFRKARVQLTYNGNETFANRTAAGVMRNLQERAERGVKDEEQRRKDKKSSAPQNKQPQPQKQQPQPQKQQPQPQKQQPQPQNKQAQPQKQQAQPQNKQAQPQPQKSEYKRDFRAELNQSLNGDKNQVTAKRETAVTPEIVNAVKDKAVAYVERLVGLMGEESAYEVTTAEDNVNIRLTSGSQNLIGQRGETLEAIEYLACLVANDDKTMVHVNLDCGNYRNERNAALIAMANARADKAVETGKRIDLEVMSSVARKVIHAALAERTDVISRSEGKDPNRHIVILPKNVNGGNNGQNGNSDGQGGSRHKNRHRHGNHGGKPKAEA